VVRCDNKLFVVCSLSDTISVFGPNNEQLAKIRVQELKQPRDIVACLTTKQLYIAGRSNSKALCVWRVSLNSRKVVKWLPNRSTTNSARFTPWTLSVTSRRLLVTSQLYMELLLYGPDGVQLKRIPVPNIGEQCSLCHSVETSHGTFIVAHAVSHPLASQISEVNGDGHVINSYSDQQLVCPCYLALDSDDAVIVADSDVNRLLLLDRDLKYVRILPDAIDAESDRPTGHESVRVVDVQCPWRLNYSQLSGQLYIGSGGSNCVQVVTFCKLYFSLIRRLPLSSKFRIVLC